MFCENWVFFFLPLFHTTCAVLVNDYHTTAAGIDDLVWNTYRSSNIPALSMSVVATDYRYPGTDIKEDFIYAKGFGMKDIDLQEHATNDTLFCVGSLTKHFTSTLVLHLLRVLREAGYNYDETSLLTDFDESLDFPGSSLHDVTVEDILSHRTGIAETFGPFLVGYSRNLTRADLALIAARTPHLRPNRDIYHYNNHVFSIGGYIAELMGHMIHKVPVTWEFLIQEHLLRPLKILNAAEFADIAIPERIASSYFTVDGAARKADPTILQLIHPAGPAGSLCLSASAMSRWMQFLLDKGSFAGQQVVAAEDIQNSWEQRISQPGQSSHRGESVHFVRTGYALGWGTGFYRGNKYLGHGGGFYSFVSLITLLPESNLAIFTSTSGPATESVKLRSLHLKIVDRLSGYQPVGPHRKHHILNETRQNVSSASTVQVRHEKYLGTYVHPVHQQLHIRSSCGQLQFLIGRFGNATIKCTISETICELDFNGILWWLSGSDAFRSDKETNRTVVFSRDDITLKRFDKISLPLYSNDIDIDFKWIPSDDWSENKADLRASTNGLDSPRNSAPAESNRFTLFLILAVASASTVISPGK